MKRTAIFLLLFPCFLLNGQFADNFEFLNHSKLTFRSSLPIVFNDNLYFVSHLANAGGTIVYKLDNENNLEVVFETGLTCNVAKLGFRSDTTFLIILEGLVEWDVSASGFISLVIDKDGTVEVDEFHRYLFLNPADSICRESWDEYLPGTVGYLDEERWVYAADDSLYIITKDCGRTSVAFGGQSKNRLQNDTNGILYMISPTPDSTIISTIDSSANLKVVSTIPGRHQYITSNQLDDFFLYSDSMLVRYNPVSGDIEDQWPLASRTSINHVYVEEEKIFLTVSNAVWHAKGNGEVSTLTSFSSEGREEQYMGIFQGDEDQLLYLGNYTERPAKHAFVRAIDTKENDEDKYDRVDLSICSFEVELTDWELDFVVQDSIKVYFLDYDAEIEICNNSDVTIHHADLWRHFHSLYTGNYNIIQDILPGESYVFSEEIRLHDEIVGSTRIHATGANYKFNESVDQVGINYKVATEDQNPEAADLNLYPNPTTGFISYESPIDFVSVKVLDLKGVVCDAYNLVDENRVDLTHLPSGIYLLIFQEGNGHQVTKKIVKY